MIKILRCVFGFGRLFGITAGVLMLLCVSCRHAAVAGRDYRELTDSLRALVDRAPGDVGIALIVGGHDTLTINGEMRFPMMSVYKLHQAIAVCHWLESVGQALDSAVVIPRYILNPDTWSPMLREMPGDTIFITVGRLLEYSLVKSDNNASNYLFENLLPVSAVRECIAAFVPGDRFDIKFTEDEVMADHSRAFENFSTPIGAAMLIDALYNDSVMTRARDNGFLRKCLERCLTGKNRIASPFDGDSGVIVAHKTGSGYVDDGVLATANDVAYIMNSDGLVYSLAVFVKNYRGTDDEASALIAKVSLLVYESLR